jgi:hypothetical protein
MTMTVNAGCSYARLEVSHCSLISAAGLPPYAMGATN